MSIREEEKSYRRDKGPKSIYIGSWALVENVEWFEDI